MAAAAAMAAAARAARAALRETARRAWVAPPAAGRRAFAGAAGSAGPAGAALAAAASLRGGSLSVADFMRLALTSPEGGYYMGRDVFGRGGDFTTSPEISQMFGELVGIWHAAQWLAMGAPPCVRVVELGPGRGTLMADFLRGTSHVPGFHSALDIHLVEVSPALRRLQFSALGCRPDALEKGSAEAGVPDGRECAALGGAGPPVRWHTELDDVPEGLPVMFVMHEFLDALPVHQFQRTEEGWCEVLVDFGGESGDGAPGPAAEGGGGENGGRDGAAATSGGDAPRMVLSRGGTPAARALVPTRLACMPHGARQSARLLEVSPAAFGVVKDVCGRLGRSPGTALIIDYGKAGGMGHSLRAIRGHRFVDVLDRPGSADLTAHVDFEFLERAVGQSGASVRSWGPVTQRHFLKSLGIDARLEQLSRGSSDAQRQALEEGYVRLVSEEASGVPGVPGMGIAYKAWALTSDGLAAPPAFVEAEDEA